MRIVMFYHSLLSDWNHGNAHFLRGVVSELQSSGHDVTVMEPDGGWSLSNLVEEQGAAALNGFHRAYPGLRSRSYRIETCDLEELLSDADLVIVHEWNEPELVQKIGKLRGRGGGFVLLFHDTHHRAATDPRGMARYDLRNYDGVLAFGGVIRDIYLKNGWAWRAWTWHEAADVRVFRPMESRERQGDLIWIGNWGDEERSEELREFLIRPVSELGLKARVHGVRYPAHARMELTGAGIDYGGWIPNYDVPETFAEYGVTVHVPRRPYVEALPGIPTIRVFEALACGIPMVCSPWDDAEGLFRPGQDYLVAHSGAEMKRHLRSILQDRKLAEEIARSGLDTILSRHTCAHRVNELMRIYREARGQAEPGAEEAQSYGVITSQ